MFFILCIYRSIRRSPNREIHRIGGAEKGRDGQEHRQLSICSLSLKVRQLKDDLCCEFLLRPAGVFGECGEMPANLCKRPSSRNGSPKFDDAESDAPLGSTSNQPQASGQDFGTLHTLMSESVMEESGLRTSADSLSAESTPILVIFGYRLQSSA